MPYTPILATLGYILSPDRSQTLMIHRNARGDDQHLGKYNGLGGKLDRGEDIVTGFRREVREEAGIECVDFTLRGTISWPGFGKKRRRLVRLHLPRRKIHRHTANRKPRRRPRMDRHQ
jgi:8-oxo-dGTP diphosphatase